MCVCIHYVCERTLKNQQHTEYNTPGEHGLVRRETRGTASTLRVCGKSEKQHCVLTRLMPRRSFSAISIVSARLYGELLSRAEAGDTVRIHGPSTPRTRRICCAQGLLAQQLNGVQTFSDTTACVTAYVSV